MGGLLGIFIVPVRAMVALMTVASLMVVTVARRGEPPFSPFEAYANVLPGQLHDSILEWGFKCQIIPAPLHEICVLTLETGIFSQIQVEFAPDGRQIGKVAFIPREKMLTLGDLVALWGKPDAAAYSGITNFRWRDVRVVAIPDVYDCRLSYWMPIRYVAFEGGN